MQSRLVRSAIMAMFVAGAAASTVVLAGDRVTIDGGTYECTTRCEITTTSDGWSLKDCCGGSVTIINEDQDPPIGD